MGAEEARIEQAFRKLAAEHDRMDHSDPHHAIPMIRGLYKIAGMPLPKRVRELIRRIEAGEDPDKFGREYEDLWWSKDSPFGPGSPLERYWGMFGEACMPSLHDDLYHPSAN